jgi:hypothetical protein
MLRDAPRSHSVSARIGHCARRAHRKGSLRNLESDGCCPAPPLPSGAPRLGSQMRGTLEHRERPSFASPRRMLAGLDDRRTAARCLTPYGRGRPGSSPGWGGAGSTTGPCACGGARRRAAGLQLPVVPPDDHRLRGSGGRGVPGRQGRARALARGRGVHEGGAALLPEIEAPLDELDELIRSSPDREARRGLQEQQANLLGLRDEKRAEVPVVTYRQEGTTRTVADNWAAAEAVEERRAVLNTPLPPSP